MPVTVRAAVDGGSVQGIIDCRGQAAVLTVNTRTQSLARLGHVEPYNPDLLQDFDLEAGIPPVTFIDGTVRGQSSGATGLLARVTSGGPNVVITLANCANGPANAGGTRFRPGELLDLTPLDPPSVTIVGWNRFESPNGERLFT